MSRLLNLLPWRRHRLEHDLDRELGYHIERRVDDLMRAGLTEREARRRAAVELGGYTQVQENVRDAWVWRWLDDRGRDLKYAARTLARSPGFTATAVLSLAIGIGASAAIFSLVDQVLLRRLPVQEPERLVLIDWRGTALADGWGSGNLMSYPICRDLQEQRQFFDGVFCRHPTQVYLSTGREHELARAEIVSGSYFPVLGVQPALGRLIDESDDRQPGAHPVVVLSYSYWQTALGSTPDIVGRRVLINGSPMTVIGVAASTFTGVDLGEVPAVWVPAMMKRQVTPEWDRLFDRRARWLHVFGRLKHGMTADQAKAGLQPWFKAMLQEDTRREGFPPASPEQLKRFLTSTIDVMPAAQGRSDLRRTLDGPLWVLMSGTLLLLLLASLNVASLFLARGAARGREIRTRMALGGSRARIAGLLLTDSMLVAIAGGLLGLVIAPAVSGTLLSYLPEQATVDLTSRMDRRVFAFAFVMSVATGVLCGLAPAWQAGRVPLIAWLRERSGGSAGVRVRKVLVVAQMAFALVLLIGAGLFVQSLARLHEKGPGFTTTNLITFGVNPLRTGRTPKESGQVLRRVMTAVRALPEVETVGSSGLSLLTGGSWNQYMTVETPTRIVTDRLVHINPVTPGFFTTLGPRVIVGRDFTDRDDIPSDDPVAKIAIVNESFAKRYFSGGTAIGRRIGLGNRPDTRVDIEIVGVVQDFAYRGIREQTEQVFLPFFEAGNFYARVRGKPELAFGSIRAAVASVDPALPLLWLRTVDEQVDRSLSTERILAALSSGFGATALLLAVVGLYGVMSFVVASRRQEIGIRLALGATRANAVRLVIVEAGLLIGAGAAIALPCAWLSSRVAESQLFGVRALDPATTAGAIALLAAVALAATMLPAWRAASVDPTEALRLE